MNHKCEFVKGTDARNHIAKCECGWEFSGTYRSVHDRAQTHSVAFADEDRGWNDLRRRTMMPMNFGITS